MSMKYCVIAVMTALLASALPAHSQVNFPTRPVRVIVPVVPGSFTDLAARALAGELAGPLGQSVVVENRPGAGTTLGADITLVAEAPYVLWSRPDLEVRSLKALVDRAKAKPGSLTSRVHGVQRRFRAAHRRGNADLEGSGLASRYQGRVMLSSRNDESGLERYPVRNGHEA